MNTDNELPIAFQGEVILQAWLDDSARGRLLTLRLPEDTEAHPFRLMRTSTGTKIAGQRFAVVFVAIDDDEKPITTKASKTYNKNASMLYRSGWLKSLDVFDAFGGTVAMKEWLKEKSCCLCENPSINTITHPQHAYWILPLCKDHLGIIIAGELKIDGKMINKSVQLRIEFIVDAILDELSGDNNFTGMGDVKPDLLHQLVIEKAIETPLPGDYLLYYSTIGERL